MNASLQPAIWFPAVRAGTGADVFTERLAAGLRKRGLRAEITWLPLRVEYAPWTAPVPCPPDWANIVHVNTWLHPRFLPKDLPTVATIHHAVHHPDTRAYKGALRAIYHRLWIAPNERRVLHRADKVVAVSRFVADTARRTLLDVPMDVIHNGVDTEKFRPGSRQHQAGGPFRLLYVGSWKRLKGVDLLAPIMHALGDCFELHYTGGREAERDKPGMPPNMHDIGRLQSDDVVAGAMQDADAFLFPSRSEGFGLVVAEAMACGLPVVTTRGSSLVEMVDDGVTGIFCPQDDVSSFTITIRRLAGSPSQYEAVSWHAREVAQKRFSEKSVVDMYINMYRELTMI